MTDASKTTVKPLLISVAIAAIVLVFAVLPSEFGIDPTGFGRLTGLSALSHEEMETSNYTETAEGEIVSDTQVWTLLPFENLEYKYHLKEGQSLLFEWSATNPVEYDFHTDAIVDGEEISDSFMIETADGARGSYVAPYDGIHGIYFENRGAEDAEITLVTYGFYDEATLYRDGGVFSQPMNGEVSE
ncbi:hypothetical protein [Ponticaulis sp.]|uniref:hypothetical protein n=1 Tax=Ponticaulis sp. TaxID=2020902 RepID=UPI000B6D712C|nr:hypothetical protein [Ponticaulis sp.]MAI91358.1 hypothetical protein [Ponticaulis sp.]OUX97955.1 MAG: hypothetical protein CBB65_13020 [Hyphomonadaceae bacterium TMED5]|tara:strand:+ start:18312 stop:18872 length:561 start_codon:yes stop_codon:yes gene_type:complete